MTNDLSLLQASRETLDLPGNSLRDRAQAVDYDVISIDCRRRIVRGMLGAMYGDHRGVGLAAPMVGLGLRIVVTIVGGRALALVNPDIVSMDGDSVSMDEANLCLPGVRASVDRSENVTVRWQTVSSGQEFTETFHGWQARVLMHEMEILEGRMFLDLAPGPSVRIDEPPDARAALAIAAALDEHVTVPARRSHPLDIATFPPDLADLPTAVVRQPAIDVDLSSVDTDLLRQVIESMFLVQYDAPGVGLAAPQVGLRLRLAVVHAGTSDPLVLINPCILDRSEETNTDFEGCLSIPGRRGPVPRASSITVLNHTLAGDAHEVEFSDYLARVVQHEIDHLDGVLYTDHVDPGETLAHVDDLTADEAMKLITKQESQSSRAAQSRSGSRPKGKRRR